MDGKNSCAHFLRRPGFIMNVCVSTWVSWKLTLVFQSWVKAAYQGCPGARAQGSMNGFVWLWAGSVRLQKTEESRQQIRLCANICQYLCAHVCCVRWLLQCLWLLPWKNATLLPQGPLAWQHLPSQFFLPCECRYRVGHKICWRKKSCLSLS